MKIKSVAIHCAPCVPWQQQYSQYVAAGLRRHGVEFDVISTRKRTKHSVAILLGPNIWKPAEEGEFIQVNRSFVGNFHDNVAISWGGFNGKGDFALPLNMDRTRLDKFIDRDDILPYNMKEGFVVCGQACPGRSTINVDRWCQRQIDRYGAVFRPHPNHGQPTVGWEETGCAITLNSTVGIDALMNGNTCVSMDEGNPLYGFTSHDPNKLTYPDQQRVLEILAHCQWNYKEIENGDAWERLTTEKRGVKLNELR
jgi:hypothetical protein